MDGAPATLESVEIQELLTLLPHRYPFLLVDRIIDIDGGESGIGIKNVSVNEPHFAGHFPGRPIMPGVLLLEGMAQTAGALSIRAWARSTPALVYLMSIDEAKFRRPVVPGDVVEYHIKKIRTRANISKYEGKAVVDGSVAAEAIITAMLAQD